MGLQLSISNKNQIIEDNRFKKLAELTSEAILVHDNGQIVDANDQFFELFQVTTDQVRDHNLVELVVHPDSQPIVIKNIRKGYEHPYQVIAQRSDGSSFDIEITGRNITWAAKPVRVVIIKNITREQERVRALLDTQEALKAGQFKLEQALKMAQLGYWELNIDTREFTFSESLYNILGTSTQEMGGERINAERYQRLFFSESDQSLVDQTIDHLIANRGKRGSNEVTHPFKRADGSPGTMLVRYFTQISPDGNDAIVIGLNRDISEQLQAQEQMLRAKELESTIKHQEEVIAFKSQFISTIAHQLKNPMAGIALNLDMIGFHIAKPNDLDRTTLLHNLERIRGNITQINQHISDLLQHSRSQAKKADFNPVSSSLVEFCKNLSAETSFPCQGDRVLEIDLPEEDITCTFDPYLMTDVLSNLLSNAFKYSDDNVLLKLTKTDKWVHITISDHGRGIPEPDLKKLFQPFFRASNVQKTPGTGLGLSIVKEFVEMQGGTINVSSKVGHGSIFTIALPQD